MVPHVVIYPATKYILFSRGLSFKINLLGTSSRRLLGVVALARGFAHGGEPSLDQRHA
jgi:hypothetical protein